MLKAGRVTFAHLVAPDDCVSIAANKINITGKIAIFFSWTLLGYILINKYKC